MDNSKEPGIKLNGVILEKSFFKRKPEIPSNFKNKLSFNLSPAFSKNKEILNLFVSVSLNTANEPIFAEITYIGVFSIDKGKENLQLEQFLNSGSALAIVLPYIREEISSRMQKANLPIFASVPLFNAMQIMKEIKSESSTNQKNSKKRLK